MRLLKDRMEKEINVNGTKIQEAEKEKKNLEDKLHSMVEAFENAKKEREVSDEQMKAQRLELE